MEGKPSLALGLQSSLITSGGSLTGTLHLSTPTPIAGAGLFLCFKGTERTQWAEKTSSSSPSEVYSSKHHLIQQKYTVFFSESEVIAAGQYSFPFTLKTPSDLPGSFAYEPEFNALKQPGRVAGTIRYFLVAKMEGPGVKIAKVKTEIGINCVLPELGDSSFVETVIPVKSWCCCGRGSVKLKADIGKGGFIPSETATVLVDINNEKGFLQARGVHLSLIRKIRLRDISGHCHTVVDSLLSIDSLQKISTGPELLSSSRCIIPLQIPQGPVTVRSNLIECDYWVQVEVMMDGWRCHGEPPTVEKRLVVYRQGTQRPVKPHDLPKDWNPVAMRGLSLNASGGLDYSPSNLS